MESRLKNSKRNIYSGIIKQIITMVFPFIIRSAIIYIFGKLYLGLGSLFSSILHVLNLADLGFSYAVVYVMYKPIADENWSEVCAIIAFLRKVYKVIGFIILGIGLCIMPFLTNLISGDYPTNINIYILYVMYLVNAVISYLFFAYKSALLTAMQRNDIVSNIGSIISLIINGLQLLIIYFTKNYYLYIIVMPIGSVVTNVLYQIQSKKLFPQIVPEGKMSDGTASTLKKQIKGIVFNRIGDVARNSFDSIILSYLLGLVVVAAYNNYYVIYSALYGVSNVIIQAIQASVGNSIAKETVEKNYKDLRVFTFIYTWIIGICTTCMFVLYQPFMYIWMRGDQNLILSFFNMSLFCIYFYAITMNNTRNLYLNGNGLFWECRIWYAVEAGANILLNFILGYLWGTSGILLASIITIFLFNFLSRNTILFRVYFKYSKKQFYLDHCLYASATIIACVAAYFICKQIHLVGIIGLVIKAIITFIVANLAFLLLCFRTSNFQEGLAFVKRAINKNKKVV